MKEKNPYPKDYQECIKVAQEEQINNIKPELLNYINSIDEYDTIYIGTPIYWGTMPQPLFTQLEKLNWNGKTVRVFITHEGSGVANVITDLKKICSDADVDSNALTIYGHDVYNSKSTVEKWINK